MLNNPFNDKTLYSFEHLADVCEKNELITVDCLKDENLVTVEEFVDDELGGECLYEFERIYVEKIELFKLIWINKHYVST